MISENKTIVNSPVFKTKIDNQLNSISVNRLKPYIELCHSSLGASSSPEEINALCLCLYTSILHRSSIFFPIIQEIEISTRNEICKALREHCEAKELKLVEFLCSFLFKSKHQLSGDSRKQLKLAITRVKGNNNLSGFEDTKLELLKRPEYEGKLIAYLGFGFWVHLFNPKDTSIFTYWSNILHKDRVFSGNFSSCREIYNTLNSVLMFRNRLFHQEAVWKGRNINTPEKVLNNLEKKYKNFSSYLLKISPERHALTGESALQSTIHELNFDRDIFFEEISSFYKDYFNLSLPNTPS